MILGLKPGHAALNSRSSLSWLCLDQFQDLMFHFAIWVDVCIVLYIQSFVKEAFLKRCQVLLPPGVLLSRWQCSPEKKREPCSPLVVPLILAAAASCSCLILWKSPSKAIFLSWSLPLEQARIRKMMYQLFASWMMTLKKDVTPIHVYIIIYTYIQIYADINQWITMSIHVSTI